MLQAAGTKPLRYYINRSQAAVAEWVAIRPIFEVCVKYTGYEGGGRVQDLWWQQATEEQQVKAMFKDILVEAWERRRR